MLSNRWFFLIVAFTCYASHAATLDELFDRAQYEKFLLQAHAKADAGDPDALFMLGKAYSLGKSVEKNLSQARIFYQQARGKGSARASNNLGVMALDDGHTEEAISLFQEALNRGLKLPTLANLGRAHTVPDPATRYYLLGPIAQARKAGDYFAQAYAHKPEIEYLFDAARQYVRSYQMALYTYGSDRESLDIPALRSQAVEWLRKGMALEHGPSWTNYGVLLLDEQNYQGAREALEKGASQKVAVAHYHLARMAQSGLGEKKGNPNQARNHFEQAAILGLTEALNPAISSLSEHLRYETDLEKLEQGIARLAALKNLDNHDNSVELIFNHDARLAWGYFLREQHRKASALPKRPVVLRACGLGFSQPYGVEFNIGENTAWRLVAFVDLAEPKLLTVRGRVNAQGCATFPKELPKQILTFLEKGAILALQFPNYALPLRLVGNESMLQLDLQPLGTPHPNF